MADIDIYADGPAYISNCIIDILKIIITMLCYSNERLYTVPAGYSYFSMPTISSLLIAAFGPAEGPALYGLLEETARRLEKQSAYDNMVIQCHTLLDFTSRCFDLSVLSPYAPYLVKMLTQCVNVIIKRRGLEYNYG